MKQVLFGLCCILITPCIFAQGITKNGKVTSTRSEYVSKNGAVGSPNGVNKNGKIVAGVSLPVVATAAITAVTLNGASSGGHVISIGESPVKGRGVCWSVNANPTIENSKTTDGAGTGAFVSSLTGLAPGTTYYVRSYATDNAGTTYGNQESFVTTAVAFGDSFGGGKVAYILVNGDAGYSSTSQHGLIVAPNDIGTSYWGCNGIDVTGTLSGIGYGYANTQKIINKGCTNSGAAKLCADFESADGYKDWYLPSSEELHILFLNRANYGMTKTWYWSSTQSNLYNGMIIRFTGGTGSGEFSSIGKNDTLLGVRPIRSF